MLKKVREKQRLTQSDLEKISGVDQTYISRLESIRVIHSPTINTIVKLSKALNICPYALAASFLDKEVCACNNCRNIRYRKCTKFRIKKH